MLAELGGFGVVEKGVLEYLACAYSVRGVESQGFFQKIRDSGRRLWEVLAERRLGHVFEFKVIRQVLCFWVILGLRKLV